MEATQQQLSEIGEYLRPRIVKKCYNDFQMSDSSKAAEVFHIPELLDLILEHVSIYDILYMTQTSQGIHAVVESSSYLQTRLFMRDGYPPSAPCARHGLYYYAPIPQSYDWFGQYGGYLDLGDRVAGFYCPNGQDRLPPVAPLWKRMRFCRPAWRSVRVFADCKECGCLNNGLDAEVLAPGRGLTFGYIYDKANEIFAGEPCVFCKIPRSIASWVLFQLCDLDNNPEIEFDFDEGFSSDTGTGYESEQQDASEPESEQD